MKKFTYKYGASIFTGLALVGFVTTTILVAKETPKAKKKLDEAKEEKGEDLNVVEKVVVAAPEYKFAIFTGLGTVVCIAGSQFLNTKKQASLTGSYILVDSQFKRYRNAVTEEYGQDADEELMAKASRTSCDFHLLNVPDPDLYVWWHEPISDQYFKAYEREVMDAEYHINRNFVLGGGISTENYLSFFPVKDHTKKTSETTGWDYTEGYMWLDFEHRLCDDYKGEPCYEIESIFAPRDFYEEGW